MRKTVKRMMVLGLDSAPPSLIFEDYRRDLPVISKFLDESAIAPLQSCVPPITVPAWTCMVTGKNPGWHGCYGFRNRKVGTYKEKWISNSRAVKEDTVWDILGRAGRRVCLLGVPQTYPPKPVNGVTVSCFLTPNTHDCHYTHPPELKDKINQWVDHYVVDVEEYRTEDKKGLLRQIYDKTEKHLVVAEKLLEQEKWDYFHMVEMGPDRIQHGLWKYCDPSHRKYDPSNEYRDAIRDYYKWLDHKLGRLLRFADEDTGVLIVSDHGAKRMDGCININEWLHREGYLHLKGPWPQASTSFSEDLVDWSRTTAWGWGGYYARVFVNVAGREPEGIVPPSEFEAVQDEISRKLRAIPDDLGKPMETRVYKPQDVYSGPRAMEAPDLIVYFGDLYWRAGQDIGHGSIYSFETEIGPDDAVHDEVGIFAFRGGEAHGGRTLPKIQIVDVASTILDQMGFAVPPGMEGQVVPFAR